jgi:DNA-directed RNA polymerase subunit F
MEQPNNLDTEKLKKVVEDIFAGGEKAVEEFDYSPYTNEELKYIMNEMHRQTKKDIEELIRIAGECEKEEGETGNGTNK